MLFSHMVNFAALQRYYLPHDEMLLQRCETGGAALCLRPRQHRAATHLSAMAEGSAASHADPEPTSLSSGAVLGTCMSTFAFLSYQRFMKVGAPSAATPFVVAGVAWDGAPTTFGIRAAGAG